MAGDRRNPEQRGNSRYYLEKGKPITEKPKRLSRKKAPVPSFNEEERLLANGYRYIAGIDEVGCGALAGPVVAAAVIMPYPLKASWLKQVRDSKLLNPEQRAILSYNIRKTAISIGIGSVPSDFIDTRGLTKARRLAMQQAIEQLSPQPESLLIDYILLPNVRIPQKGVVDGDSLCFSIACASIVAKVARDSLMAELDKIHPGYGLAQHKGYGTKEHLDCLQRLGPSPIHRLSFQPVQDARQNEA
ncbi:MAG: ribonuclease HII [Chloroflexi bacterium]|nr:ribonuclease HII [Chloroflexota bacterium]